MHVDAALCIDFVVCRHYYYGNYYWYSILHYTCKDIIFSGSILDLNGLNFILEYCSVTVLYSFMDISELNYSDVI